jgi:hypothetical protein
VKFESIYIRAVLRKCTWECRIEVKGVIASCGFLVLGRQRLDFAAADVSTWKFSPSPVRATLQTTAMHFSAGVIENFRYALLFALRRSLQGFFQYFALYITG